MQLIESNIVNELHTFADASKNLTHLVIFLAGYSQYLLALVVLYLALCSRKWFKVTVLAVLAACIARYGVKEVIVLFVERARPFITNGEIHPFINTSVSENYQSFPSGHAIAFFALAAVIYKYNRKWGIFFFMSAICMGVARVTAGVHYPTDIIWGAILGVSTGVCVVFLVDKLTLNKYRSFNK